MRERLLWAGAGQTSIFFLLLFLFYSAYNDEKIDCILFWPLNLQRSTSELRELCWFRICGSDRISVKFWSKIFSCEISIKLFPVKCFDWSLFWFRKVNQFIFDDWVSLPVKHTWHLGGDQIVCVWCSTISIWNVLLFYGHRNLWQE